VETRDHNFFQFYSKKAIFPENLARLLKSPGFSPKVAEIPNLGTNFPEVGTLAELRHWMVNVAFICLGHLSRDKFETTKKNTRTSRHARGSKMLGSPYT